MHSKNYTSRFIKTTYNLERREYSVNTSNMCWKSTNPQASRWHAVPDRTCAMAARSYSGRSILWAPPWILHGLAPLDDHWPGVGTSITCQFNSHEFSIFRDSLALLHRRGSEQKAHLWPPYSHISIHWNGDNADKANRKQNLPAPGFW